MDATARAAAVSVVSNTFLVVTKIVVGLMMGSVSVMSEAAHSGLDLLAAGIAYFSVREARKPADAEHPYGHGKFENVSGVIEAALVLAAGVLIIYEAVWRLIEQAPVELLGLGMVVMGFSAALNLGVSTYLERVARLHKSVALKADALHLRTDVYSSLGVLGGLMLLRLTGWTWIDPVAAIAAALFILYSGWNLAREAFHPLLDHKLSDEEEAEIRGIIDVFNDRYLNVHALRSRRAGHESHVDLHMVVHRHEPVGKVHDLCDEIEASIAQRFPHAQVLIHVEPCDPDCEPCCAREAALGGARDRVQA